MDKTQELAGVSPVFGTRGLTNAKSRNSWAQQHERRKSIRLLGNVVELDEWLDWRLKWGQRGAAASQFVCLLFYTLNNVFFGNHNSPLFVATLLFFVGFVIGLGTLYFKNVSSAIARRLLKEVNVVMILLLGISIFIIDCVKPYNSFSPINGFIYLFGTTLVVFLDAVKKKSRVLVLVIGFIFILVTLYNIYMLTFTGTDTGVILFQYNNDYVFYKRSSKRSCYIQIFLFSMNGMWTMLTDKKMEKMMFATGNIYHGMISRGERLPWSVKWGQRGTAVCGSFSVVFFVLNSMLFDSGNTPLHIALVVVVVGFVICFGMVYYKNISFMMARKLLKELNVVMILVLGVCIATIDCVKPYNAFSPVNGFINLVCIALYLFLDAVKKKSRSLALIIMIVFLLVTLWNIYCNTFLDDNIGVVLFQYGDDYVFRKRSIKRSCFIQIFLFSIDGMWTMFTDKKMEKMMFATGHIYRETGTASKYVEIEIGRH